MANTQDTPDANAPEADTSIADFTKLKTWVKASLDAHSDWYAEAKECFGFVAGRSMKGEGQWPEGSWDEMIASGRQPIEFNRCGPIIDSICGMEVNNRQEVKYLPRTEGDTQVDERLTSLGDWARDETQAEDEESVAFRDAVICGRGWTETRLDFDVDPMGKIVIEALDPLECGVDPASRRANFTNSRYRWRFRDIDTDEAAGMFPGILSSALDASWAKTGKAEDGGEGNKSDYPDRTRSSLRGNKPPKTVRIVQVQWWAREPAMMVALPGADEPQIMSADEWEAHPANPESAAYPPPMPAFEGAPEEAEQSGATAQKIEQRRYYQAFLGRNTALPDADGKTETVIECFTLEAITGRFDRNKGYHYGVVRPMRDPQMLANKTLSQVLHILNTNAKGGLIIEKGVFANPRDAEKDWSDPSKTIVVNAGGTEKIKDRTAPALPVALVQMQEFSVSSIRDVTGVSVEMLGLADREQAASLEYQRRQSAMTILASLFDALRRYRKTSGITMLEQLKKLPPGVLVRVLIDPKQAEQAYQQQMMQWQQAAQMAQQQGQELPPKPQPMEDQFKDARGERFDPAAFGLGGDAKFDVIVDEAPSSPNQKEATWSAIQPFMATMPPQAVPIALKYSPLPESVAKELGEAISGAAAGPQIPPELQSQIEKGQQEIQKLTEQTQQLAQENAELKADQANKAAKVQVDDKNAETKRIQALTAIPPQNDQEKIAQLERTIAEMKQTHDDVITAFGG